MWGLDDFEYSDNATVEGGSDDGGNTGDKATRTGRSKSKAAGDREVRKELWDVKRRQCLRGEAWRIWMAQRALEKPKLWKMVTLAWLDLGIDGYPEAMVVNGFENMRRRGMPFSRRTESRGDLHLHAS